MSRQMKEVRSRQEINRLVGASREEEDRRGMNSQAVLGQSTHVPAGQLVGRHRPGQDVEWYEANGYGVLVCTKHGVRGACLCACVRVCVVAWLRGWAGACLAVSLQVCSVLGGRARERN